MRTLVTRKLALSHNVACSYFINSAQVLCSLASQLSECYGIMIGNWIYWTLELVTAKDYDVVRTNGSAGR
jgi:hypothetical protein